MRTKNILIRAALFLFCTLTSLDIKAQCQSLHIIQDKKGGCPPTTISFELQGAEAGDKIVWIINKTDSIYTGDKLSHIFNKLGEYEVTAVAIAASGKKCTANAPAMVSITSGPSIQKITASRNQICSPDTVKLTAEAEGAVQYDWIIEGVNYTDAGPVVTHKFNTPEYHNITLRVKDELGCYSMSTFKSVVYMKYFPAADIISNVPGGCIPFDIDFKANITSGESKIVSYEWHFEGADNPHSTMADPGPVTYSRAGDFPVRLTVKTADGCSYNFKKENAVRAGQPVNIDFEADTTAGYVRDTFIIKNTSTPGPGYFKWDLKEGRIISATPTELKVVFYKPGEYDVKLVYEHAKCSQAENKTAYLKVISKDTVNSTIPCWGFKAHWYIKRTLCIGEGIPVSSNANNYKGAKVKWRSNEHIRFYPADTVHEPVVTATKGGNHALTMYLTNEQGCIDSMTIMVSVYDPEISFSSLDTINTCAPAYVRFKVQASDADTFFWYFGDGSYLATTSTEIAHLYQMNSGQEQDKGFDVMVIAKSNTGCSDTAYRKGYIKVFGPVPSFIVTSAKTGTDSLTVTFKNTSKYINNFYFDYGDNTPFDSNRISPHTYRITHPDRAYQVFRPRLLVQDLYGCASVYELPDSIVVYRKPDASFKPSAEKTCENVSVKFINTSKNAAKWYWDFESDGRIDDTTYSPEHFFNPGEYVITLIAENAVGYKDTFMYASAVEVYPKPMADFEISTNVICLGTTLNFTAKKTHEGQKFNWRINDEPHTESGQIYSKQFLTPGQHRVELSTTNESGCTDTLSQDVFVMDDLPPAAANIIAASWEYGGVSISWVKPQELGIKRYRVYRVQDEDTALIALTSSNADSIHFDPAAEDAVGYYIQVEDICGLISSPSVLHRPITLRTSPVKDQGIKLEWSAYEGWKDILHYEILRTDPASGEKKKIATVNPSTLSFLDTDICIAEYCYIVVAVNIAGAKAKSNSSCTESPSKLFTSTDELKTVSVTAENTLTIDWEPTTARKLKHYIVERQSADEKIEVIAYTGDSYWEDTKAKTAEKSYVYRISVLDSCGNVVPYNNVAQSILLKAEQSAHKTTLTWNRYGHWDEGVEAYELEIKEDGAYRSIARLSPGTTLYSDDQLHSNTASSICYRITAIRGGGKQDISMSNEACITPPSVLHAPNAFSPNGDGLNDEFRLISSSLIQQTGLRSEYRINIFDRWGTNVFSSGDINHGWDGTYDGKSLAPGVYSYKIYAVGYDGQHYSLEGTVNLIR